ncbi:helix-turn-helix domain-containing protein [Clostridium sp. D53t1_180928_C8]|uniref:helix-turn-helix domain-containing protein n=1 Tax=Clostridium sp. D53t1_180928_C8 TaxID=2787101 RepID=UPI0018ABFE57
MLIKVLIADDELRIRNSIKSIISWEFTDFELVGEAEDGEIALEIARERKPDLIFLDISMQFLNRLDLIEEFKRDLNDPIIIIISGDYVQTKLKLNIFDYILSNIDKENLKKTISNAKDEIINRRKKKREFATSKLEKDSEHLKENFLKDWIRGKIRSSELEREMKYFNITYTNSMGLIMVKPLIKSRGSTENNWSSDLLSYAILNITNEIMNKFEYLNVFIDSKKQVVILCDINPIKYWHGAVTELENTINRYLKINVVICASFLRDDPVQVNIVYKSLCNRLIDKSKKTPVVIEVQKYINRNYHNEDLSISEIANNLGVSQTYLTRLFKRELGMNFIDYLTNVRIKNAIILMRDPSLKLYEIAELIGYSTQHYFSNIFKKHVGISPQDYKMGVINEARQ